MADGRPIGRGRGRARTVETAQTAMAPGGAAAPPPSAGGAAGPSDVGRRGATGRRAETGQQSSGSPPDKKGQRGSPADTGSPTMAEKMAGLELISLASRPGYGTLGRKYRMLANHFEVKFPTKMLMVNQYHIEITHFSPRVKLTRDENRPILWQCLLNNDVDLNIAGNLYKIAYDGVSNLYTLDPLTLPRENMKKFDIEILIPKFDKPAKFTVLIQAVGPLAINLQQVVSSPSGSRYLTPIQVLDVILRQYRSNPHLDSAKAFYPFGSSIFMIPTPDLCAINLDGGREIWRGLFTSAHVGQNFRPFVNMDIVHTAFYKQGKNGNNGPPKYSCIEFLCEALTMADRGANRYSPDQLKPDTMLTESMVRVFEREIKGLRIVRDYNIPNAANPNREFKVLGVDRPSAHIKFQNREGVEVSVADYYRDMYGPLKFPLMPTLKVGSKIKPIHLPIEHCNMARNQKSAKKLTESQTATMIRQTCMPPADRRRAIEHMVRMARFPDDPFLKSFGIQPSTEMTSVNGRVLPAPAIGYNNSQAQVRDGVWRNNNNRFISSAQARGVAAMAFSPPKPPPNTESFIAQLLSACKHFGMNVPDFNAVYCYTETDNSPQRVEKAMRTVMLEMKRRNLELDLLIVLIPVKGHALYPEVKRVAEIQMGVMTQCVTYKTISKFSNDTLANIVFKINMKLGGINCDLSVRDAVGKCLFVEPTIALGIDVTHPGPTDKRSPSVASVVGSMDKTFMRYAASIKVQKQRREALVYLSEPVTERLMYFYKSTKVKPNRIIVYRDGVSEGEFKTVLREELRGIREACLKMDPNFKPKITFIVVQKRHHTRLFPENPSEGCGRALNVFPGSVVETDILFHEDFSFYLCSHAGIQGTSRPTRYHVLHDDNNFSADDIQLMSFYLCHCFSRCTRSVSIPAPVYYAHLACTRARAHLQNVVGDSLSDTASSRSGDQGQSSSIPEEELIQAATVCDNIRKEMYFT